jgi:hypothetical protein
VVNNPLFPIPMSVSPASRGDRPFTYVVGVDCRLGRVFIAGIALLLAWSGVVRAQETPADAGAAWVAASVGYSAPGTAAMAEAWLRPAGWFVVGGQLSNAEQGGFDSSKSTDVYSLVAGVRVPAGRLRITLAAGRGEATSDRSDRQNGTRAVWNVGIDWPVSKHVAWHASHFAIVGGQRPYVLDTIGLAIGGVH